MKRLSWRAVLPAAVLLALAATAAVATAPAAAAPREAAASPLCNPFSSLPAVFSPSSGLARGGEAREPALNEKLEEVPGYARGRGGPAFKATVDVYVHSVTDGSTGAVTDTQIADQITVMNNGFGAERNMKKTLHRGDASDLNLYLTTASAYLGWAYFPSSYKTKPWIDGVVADWESMLHTSTSYVDRYDLGKTATHETGHWLGLYHVFQGGCNNFGDYVDDTPPQRIATRGCPEGQDSCPEPGLDSIHNYMDYSYDSCYNQYTAGQAARMQDQWLYYRANGGFTVQ